MILFVEPISTNIGMYVPAYPLPLIEIGSFVKANLPEEDIDIISMPMDYGIPLTKEGKDLVYTEFVKEVTAIRPQGIGISCTAIAQAEEVIQLCELIKEKDQDVFVFLGGYFPTIYYEEIFSRTSAVDVIVIGEGEIPAIKIVEHLRRGEDPRKEEIPNLAWKRNGQIYLTGKASRFNLKKKAFLNLNLLRHPMAYDVLPYAFSRGCPYQCSFCMEEFMRPVRKEVPREIVQVDLQNLTQCASSSNLVVSDALFKSFDLFPLFRSLAMKVNFETRCDVLDPSIIPEIADVCGMLALGFESASYDTLRRMNKVKDKSHYEQYLSNTKALFKEAAKNGIPIVVFLIAGYPGDSERDLEESLVFAKELSECSGPGGHVFKIGECRAYPKTKTYNFALSSSEVSFDDDSAFGDNIVRQSSKDLRFETILEYMTEIFNLSNNTPRLINTTMNITPFFRVPAIALRDPIIPDACFTNNDREVFDVKRENLLSFKKSLPKLTEKYKKLMSNERSTRKLQL